MAAVLAIGALCLPTDAESVSTISEISNISEIAGISDRDVVAEEYKVSANSNLPAPTCSMSSGSYIVKDGFKVRLSGASDSDEIWYSINGTGYRRYTEPLSITQSTVLRAYRISGGKQSDVATYIYELIPMLSVSLNSGTYNGVQRVFINCSTPNTKLYYTLDGSSPNEHSTEYSSSSGILIGLSSTLKVIAVKIGWSRYVRTYNYTINGGRDVSQDPNPDGGLVIVDSTEKTVSQLDNYTEKWGYNQLNASQKAAYDKLFAAAKNYTSQIDVSKLYLKANEFEEAYWAFDRDNPQFLALGSGYSYYYYISSGYLKSVNIQYGRSYADIMSIQKTFDDTVGHVTSTAKNQLNDYAKLKYIHDWIVSNTDYISGGPAYKSEADGAIVYGKALCEGYSKAFMYMAQKLGFECICVVGTANNTAHMWNMVKMNGAWYHVDVTFDDPVMSDGSKALSHDYFLVGTSEISKTHTINSSCSVPSAPRSYKP